MTALVAALRRQLSLPNFKIDWVLGSIGLMFLALAVFDTGQIKPSLDYMAHSVLHILPYFLIAIGLASYVKVTGADQLIAKAFSANKTRSIILAAMIGGLSPFCSCGVIPLVVALLAAGVPLSPVMAFLIASPLMDPEMFAISTGVMGLEFTLGRTAIAIAGGMTAGFLTAAVDTRAVFADSLRAGAKPSCCSSKKALGSTAVNWTIWDNADDRRTFFTEVRKTGWFLGRWMLFAYALSSLMIAYIPESLVTGYLGSGSWWTVPLAVLIGLPMYLNGYAATPLVAELMNLGMAPGAGMAFLTAGAVACVPSFAALAPVLKKEVMALYVGMGLIVSLLGGLVYQFYVGL